MATRPVFIPDIDPDNPQLVHEHEVDFQWLPGPSPEQSKVNIAKLHAAASRRNLAPLLEISPESDDPLGAKICASNLAVEDGRSYLVPLNAVYHGSMVFTGGGPFTDLYGKSDEKITGDERLTSSGKHVGFRFMDLEWGTKSGTMFYDWLTIHAIHRYQKLRMGIHRFRGFTDIDCHPQERTVCHARSCALYVALVKKKLLDGVVRNQDLFIETLIRDSFYRSDRST
jgi:hypothetical protein